MKYVCNICSAEYPVDTLRYRCQCGGLFSLEYEKKEDMDFSVSARSLWRFSSMLPPLSKDVIDKVTMQEGGTPLISLGENLEGKAEYFMPTLSFKDRGAAVLVSLMSQIGISHCAVDSSGNAGTSVAAYCARAGIGCDVFVPSRTSDKKICQIKAHGACVHEVEGSREFTTQKTIEFVESNQVFYASHIFNPFFYEGTKTYIYELYESYGGSLPDIIILPVGNGTLFLGASIALEEMLHRDMIDSIPLIVAVQAENCAPVAHAHLHDLTHVEKIETCDTAAEGIASALPLRGDQILAHLRKNGGIVVTVSEQQIVEAHKALAMMGLFVEITSAANYAGYLKLISLREEYGNRKAVIPLCGAGLKSVH